MNREFAEEVFRVRQEHPSIFRSRRRINLFVEDLIELLFPHLSGESVYYSAAEIEGRLAVLGRDLKVLLQAQQGTYIKNDAEPYQQPDMGRCRSGRQQGRNEKQ